MAPTEYIREQGRYGLRNPPPIDNSHLARDTNVDREVVILVYPPRPGRSRSPRDLHWSLSWRVEGGGWKHLHVVVEETPYDAHLKMRYVYWGPVTKTVGDATRGARYASLGYMSRASRQRIEALAWGIGVAKPNGEWNCQNWVVDLLCKICQDGLIDQAKWSDVMATASHRTCFL
ncbi:hypothetical protein L227DRAFT_515239 [Lentinus tigrinus ALCF2SS1-6]|uniref:Uncharacterized protein n=1 Tax=Lentinus tigrinus ALCF2SS1-6 TaxID=1328759 RepID=A0A5C2RLX0_9APHY|nr:hypothetical protein L227DRAFT_515239 [Lentinus tigrinus ALCF2SS1-6]